MPTQWSEAEQAPLGCIAPHTAQRCHSEPVTDVTGVGIRSPFYASGGLFSFNSERKEEKKRRQKLRFWISLRAFARRLSRLFYHANAVPCKFRLNVALSLLLSSLPLLL